MTRGVWIGIAALVAGCATAPPVAPPSLDVATPESWTARTDTGDAPDFGWWRDFGDAALDDVVLAALEENYDLQAAAARLEQAAADSRIAAADLQPTVQAGLNGSRRKQNFIGFPIPGSENQVLSTVFTNYGVSVDTTWEADLWGRLRSGARAALADGDMREAWEHAQRSSELDPSDEGSRQLAREIGALLLVDVMEEGRALLVAGDPHGAMAVLDEVTKG